MNKQELINRLIKLLEAPSEIGGSDFDDGHNYGIERAILLAEQLNEQQAQINKQEKPVVPQFIDAWIQAAKNNGFDLYEAMTDNEMSDNVATWIVYNSETFAKAWIYGYEVEKEKLYTVFQLATHEFLYTEPSGSLRSDAVTWAYAAETEEYHFMQQKLEELHYWDNPAFEIKEVTE